MEQRSILFQGKEINSKKWIQGHYSSQNDGACFNSTTHHYISEYVFMDWDLVNTNWHEVFPESVGQYTGMNEFVMTDESFNAPLFEGDIVEVWSRRRPKNEPMILARDELTSQYDCEYRVRAVIVFKNGEWYLDYDNAYNHILEGRRGNETTERTVHSSNPLYAFGYHGKDEEAHRKRNQSYKWTDIVKVGNIFDDHDILDLQGGDTIG